MRNILIAASMTAAAIVPSFAVPVSAQTAQEQLDAKYERALAAGYKALMLCSAIGNAEANGGERTEKSVLEWELTGIQAPLDVIVRELPHKIVRRPSGQIAHVAVEWDEDMPPRVAAYFAGDGCSALPMGAPESWSEAERDVAAPKKDKIPAPTSPITDKGPLKPIFEQAFAGGFGEGSRTTSTLVLKDGRNVAERYADGFYAVTPQRTWSVAKSITATLAGAAVLAGENKVDDPVGMNYWRQGGASEPRNAITLDHMLRMASGRYTDTPGNRSLGLYWGGSTVNETATGWPIIHKPGTVFRYANNDALMAVKAIDGYLSYYEASEFFAKVGMDHTVAETDIRGDYILSSQAWSNARDLAKLGQLYLDNGVINKGTEEEERVLPENWRTYVSTPSGPQPKGRNVGYGAGFWLMNQTEGVPNDTFFASGRRGQYIVIVPSRDVVIVRRGEDPLGKRFDIASFTRDVLAALPN